MNSYDALLIDAGTGNLHSVYNALCSQGFEIKITEDAHILLQRSRVILPGVGAFGSFIHGLISRGLTEALQEVVQRGDPLLGICVGMQVLFEVSEEMGEHSGLGLLPGRVIRFPDFPDIKVPHTGWNQLWYSEKSTLLEDLPRGAYAYFNHAYYCAPSNPEDMITSTDYGIEFASTVHRDNLVGVQFHPEKSQTVGLKILANFFNI